jgi:hypothetical protein
MLTRLRIDQFRICRLPCDPEFCAHINQKTLPFCESQLNFLILLAFQVPLDGRSGLLGDPEFCAHFNQNTLPFCESQLNFLIFHAIQALLDG